MWFIAYSAYMSWVWYYTHTHTHTHTHAQTHIHCTAMILPYFYEGLYFGGLSWVMLWFSSVLCVFVPPHRYVCETYNLCAMYVIEVQKCVSWYVEFITCYATDIIIAEVFETEIMATVVLCITLSCTVMLSWMNWQQASILESNKIDSNEN
jgi:hypothetical protein